MFTFSSLSFLCFSSSRVFIIAMRLTMFMLFFLLFLVYVFLSSGDKVFFGAPLTGRTPRGRHELDLSFLSFLGRTGADDDDGEEN